MTPLTLLLLLAASRVDLVDEVVQIPPGEWRYVEFKLKQQPVLVAADFDSGTPGKVRLLLLRREDVERLREDRGHGIMAATAPGHAGRMRYDIRTPGAYAVVVDNRAGEKAGARVHLRVALDFAAPAGPGVTYLAPGRQLAVIVISFAFFFAVVTWSARRIIRAIKG